MLRANWILALRNLGRQKVLSMIKIAGLVIGITACLVVFLIAHFELSFDSFHPDRDRIYRVYTERVEEKEFYSGVPTAVHTAISNNVTGVESVCNFHTFHPASIKVPAKNEMRQFDSYDRVIITPPDYFAVFNSYEWILGTPQHALRDPLQVVLTESRARTYFGDLDLPAMIGREVHYNDSLVVTVSGIVKDIQQKTDLDFTDFISFGSIESSWLRKSIRPDQWRSVNSSSQLFIRLMPNTPILKIEEQMPKLEKLYADRYQGRSWGHLPRMQPLSDLHFNSELGIFDHSRPASEKSVLYSLILIAALLLVIALINYVNLETAQAARRSKEVGIRKALGSSRSRLVSQFMMQTFIFSASAAVVSPFMAWLTMHYFEDFLPPGLELSMTDPLLWMYAATCIVVVTVLAGLYPAFVLSSGQPSRALKNAPFSSTGISHAVWMRKGLTVFQFLFSQVLLIVTIAIAAQVDYMLSKDLGYATDAVIYFNTPWREKSDKKFLLKNELARLPQIESISLSSPPCFQSLTATVKFEKGQDLLRHEVVHKSGDTTYMDTYGLQLVAGRNFSASDSARECLINETYMQVLGYDNGRDLIGGMLDRKYTIVGVVKDFHSRSLHNVIEPTLIYHSTSNCIALKLAKPGATSEMNAVLHEVKIAWNRIYPDKTIEFKFLNDTVRKLYDAERRASKLMITATGIAVLVSCLGLFGLSSFTVIQRTKEISIRKVFGGTVNSIVMLLSKGFLKYVVIAFVMASPLAYYLITIWLQDFAYRKEPGVLMFIVPGLLSVLIAFFTVSFHTISAAKANPVKFLRYE